MKRKLLALTLAAALLALCAACTPTGQTPEDSAPEGAALESPAPEDIAPERTAPVEYDFNGAVLDEYTGSLTGFEGLPWGEPLPQEMVDRLPDSQLFTLVNPSAEFAGLEFRAEQCFNYTATIPDLSQEARVLTMGQFIRLGYTDLYGENRNDEMAVSDFNQVLAYLTEIYGQPDRCELLVDGASSETLAGSLTTEQFRTPGVSECYAVWNGLEGATVSLTLNTAYGGSLFVTFGMKS